MDTTPPVLTLRSVYASVDYGVDYSSFWSFEPCPSAAQAWDPDSTEAPCWYKKRKRHNKGPIEFPLFLASSRSFYLFLSVSILLSQFTSRSLSSCFMGAG